MTLTIERPRLYAPAPLVLPDIDRAHDVLDYIGAHPCEWDQKVWYIPREERWLRRDIPATGCFAGLTCLLAGYKIDVVAGASLCVGGRIVFHQARELLRIDVAWSDAVVLAAQHPRRPPALHRPHRGGSTGTGRPAALRPVLGNLRAFYASLPPRSRKVARAAWPLYVGILLNLCAGVPLAFAHNHTAYLCVVSVGLAFILLGAWRMLRAINEMMRVIHETLKHLDVSSMGDDRRHP